jgi:hypothetical protein
MGIELDRDQLRVDGALSLSVQRAPRLRRAIEGQGPSSLGLLPLHRVAEHPALPARVRRRGGFFTPLGREESFWIGIDAVRPYAVRVGLGRLDALTGRAWRRALDARLPNYVVAPPPRSIFGIRLRDGSVRQFEFDETPLRLVVVPSQTAARESSPSSVPFDRQHKPRSASLCTGGQATGQPRSGRVDWDDAGSRRVTISLVDPAEYRVATGRTLPPPPPSNERYVPRPLP